NVFKTSKMKRLLPVLLMVAASFKVSPSVSQTTKTFTLEDCYQFAKENYPLIRQRELITKSKELSIQNIANGFLPQINFMGQASYQSAVTKIPIKIPGMNVPELSKDQYKVYGEVTQSIYDGGLIKEQKKLQEANSMVEDQQLEVELYTLKERINQLFFGVLLVNERLQQNDLLKKDIEAGLNKTKAAIEYGTALKSSADVLKAELLNADQHAIELRAFRAAYLKMLGLFINQSLDENVKLITPQSKPISQEIQRPELLLFNSRQKAFEAQKNIISAKNRPKFGLFFQGGIGRPGLDFLSNSLDPYYIGGIRLSWPLSGLYNAKNDRALLENSHKNIDIQRETFLFNTNLSLNQETEEINKLKALLQSDNDIIELRTNVKNTALGQLENGVITSNDYIREVDAEDMARQNKSLHEIQLLLAEYNQQVTSGN
ncbi:MAG: TolC family protein, partial [Ginsengibacter sp.]